MTVRFLYLAGALALSACGPKPEYDVVIRNGVIIDGSGGEPSRGSVALLSDTIAAVGDLGQARGRLDIDANGMIIAPGFINMLSWANESLLEDGRSQSDIRQGITLEVMGEGFSMGPLTEGMKREMKEEQGDLVYDIPWTTLGESLEHVERRGVSANIASFVGATTVRIHVLGYANRPPNAAELDRMKALVRHAMEDGALGLSSALIYAPGFYAQKDELIALASVAAEYSGMYISHIRNEGNALTEAVEEFLDICRAAHIRSEIYHLKAAGQSNWHKLDRAIGEIEEARRSGFSVTADMYTYTAGATGLDASMPPWVQEGGLKAWIERLKDPDTRARLAREMTTPTSAWENLYQAAGTPDKILLVGFKQDSLKYLTGKTLREVALLRGTSPEETIMNLVIDDGSRVGTVYFLMSEENVRKEIALPWVSFGSDEASLAPEGVFLKSSPHPRAYGNVARLLGRYVRTERIVSLPEAVRRLSSFPAQNLGLSRRGLLVPGYYADVIVFDSEKIEDRATFENPHQYSVGVQHVFVNGVQVLAHGEHTGKLPGRVVRGPGWTGRR
jgi:N-acyl-D-amino-acid deacylase